MGHSGNPYGGWFAPSRLFNAYVNWSRAWRNWTIINRVKRYFIGYGYNQKIRIWETDLWLSSDDIPKWTATLHTNIFFWFTRSFFFATGTLPVEWTLPWCDLASLEKSVSLPLTTTSLQRKHSSSATCMRVSEMESFFPIEKVHTSTSGSRFHRRPLIPLSTNCSFAAWAVGRQGESPLGPVSEEMKEKTTSITSQRPAVKLLRNKEVSC